MRILMAVFSLTCALAMPGIARAGDAPRMISAFAMTRSNDATTRVIEYYGAERGSRAVRTGMVRDRSATRS